ncbi:MAG: hypothetical protein LIO71_08885 [Ruminococcus sp.]|nr:hypothetical protein [Ruminococcus sp.]
MYSVVSDTVGNRYKRLSGQVIKEKHKCQAEPDFYVRNGKYVFLFESKDVLVNSEIKLSSDYTRIYDDLKKKFYEDNGSPKAVKQLLYNVERLIKEDCPWDGGYPTRTLEIYPILVLHDNIYNCPGVQELVSEWFGEDLQLRGLENDKRIKPITVINIGAFILYKSKIQSKRLNRLIEDYHKSKFSDREKVAKDVQKKGKEAGREAYYRATRSFEYYLSGVKA